MSTSERNQTSQLHGRLWRFWPWAAAALVVLTSSWFADESRDLLIQNRTGPSVASVIFCLVLFVGATRLLYVLRDRFPFVSRPQTRDLRSQTCPHRPHLVLFLSPEVADVSNGPAVHKDGKLHFLSRSANIDTMVNFTESVAKNLDVLDKIEREESRKNMKVRWRWEMPLRGIAYQIGRQDSPKLETVTLVCSEKSLPQAHLFANVMREFLGETAPAPKLQLLLCNDSGVRIESLDLASPQESAPELGWDFEDFNALIDGLYGFIAVMSKQGIAENQIILDVTGGQKPTSIAAASITINREVVIQYIQTNNKHEPRGYDVIHPTGETPGLDA